MTRFLFVTATAFLVVPVIIVSTVIAEAQLNYQYQTRSGVLEFKPNGYPTDETVVRVQEEMDYQRAVQAYLQLLPAVGIMQWYNAHFELGGKTGDWIIYDTTELKMPILTSNATTPYILTFANLMDTDGLLMLEVPPGPTGGMTCGSVPLRIWVWPDPTKARAGST